MSTSDWNWVPSAVFWLGVFTVLAICAARRD